MVRRGGGAEFAIGYEILELVEPELIVLRSDPMPEVGVHEPTVVRVEFHDHGAKTRMTLSDGPLPPEGRSGAEAGWSAAFDKLAALVAAYGPLRGCMGADHAALLQRLTDLAGVLLRSGWPVFTMGDPRAGNGGSSDPMGSAARRSRLRPQDPRAPTNVTSSGTMRSCASSWR
jgi:hypothetical protein